MALDSDPALAALEVAASALRADLAARGVPADDEALPDVVMLALADLFGRLTARLEQVEARCDALLRLLPFDRAAGQERLSYLATAPPEAPRFRHDCESCVFLGRSADGMRDLYFCNREGVPPQLLIRFGDPGGLHEIIHPVRVAVAERESREFPSSYSAEAYRQAVARGLVVGVDRV